MSAQNYSDLAVHFGHSLTVALYGEGDNIAIECEECSEVLLDFDNEDEDFNRNSSEETTNVTSL